jgi:hypothetical protein
MVNTFDYGTKRSFANLFHYFETIPNLVSLLQTVVAFCVIEPIVYEPL